MLAMAAMVVTPLHGQAPNSSGPQRLDSQKGNDGATVQHVDSIDLTAMRRHERKAVESPTEGKRIVRVKSDLDNSVDFSATDSLVLIGTDRALHVRLLQSHLRQNQSRCQSD